MEIIILDGATSIGGTKLYVGEGKSGVLVDFGINYKRWGMYYEEYLKPRTPRGLVDLLHLGLIPQVANLYREDLFPEDLSSLSHYSELPLNALFISHAHMDHCGFLGVINEELPIYTSSLTAALMKAMQDSRGLPFYSELTYITKRERTEDPKTLRASDWRRTPYEGRRFFIIDSITEELQDFWTKSPKSRSLSGKHLIKAQERVGSMSFYAFPVDHSIPGATAYIFETAKGYIVYTGDFRMHGRGAEDTRKFIDFVKKIKPFILITEGTSPENIKERITEEEVCKNALSIVRESRGKLVIADFGPRNLERLETFLEIASETGRILLVLPKDVYLLEAVSRADNRWWNILSHDHLCIFDEIKEETNKWEEEVRDKHKSRLIKADEVKTHIGDFIVAFSFLDMKHLLDIKPCGGTYIYSSSEAYCEEEVIDMKRLWNWLHFFEMEVYGFELDERGNPLFPQGFHASGHAPFWEIIDFIKEVQPKHLIPIHTENPHAFEEALQKEPIKVHLLQNGKRLFLK